MRFGFGAGVGVLTIASVASADVTYTDVERNIEVSFGSAAPSVWMGEFGTGFWDESVLGSYEDAFGFGAGEATQTSDVSGDMVMASGFVSAFASTDGYVQSYSSLSVFIAFTEATAFHASAVLFDLFQGNPTLSFAASLLDESGQDLWSMSTSSVSIPDTGSFEFEDETGVIGPGTYLLDVRMLVEGIKDAETSGSFRFELSVPSPGAMAVGPIAGAWLLRRRRRWRQCRPACKRAPRG